MSSCISSHLTSVISFFKGTGHLTRPLSRHVQTGLLQPWCRHRANSKRLIAEVSASLPFCHSAQWRLAAASCSHCRLSAMSCRRLTRRHGFSLRMWKGWHQVGGLCPRYRGLGVWPSWSLQRPLHWSFQAVKSVVKCAPLCLFFLLLDSLWNGKPVVYYQTWERLVVVFHSWSNSGCGRKCKFRNGPPVMSWK